MDGATGFDVRGQLVLCAASYWKQDGGTCSGRGLLTKGYATGPASRCETKMTTLVRRADLLGERLTQSAGLPSSCGAFLGAPRRGCTRSRLAGSDESGSVFQESWDWSGLDVGWLHD